MTSEQWQGVIGVHLTGAWLGTKYASLVMHEQKRGANVTISALSSEVDMVVQTNYSAAEGLHGGPDEVRRQGAGAPRGAGQTDPARTYPAPR